MINDDLSLDGDWSELPGDLIGLIIDELKKNTFFLLDYIRFGAVCVEWRRSFICIQNYKEQIKLPGNLPVLLIPTLSHEDYYNDDEDEYDDNEYDDNNQGGEHEHDEGDYADEDEQEILQEDGFGGDEEDEHEILQDGFDGDEEEELEMPYNYYYYNDEDDGREPPHQYYKRKAIWKGQDETRHKSTRSFYSLSERKIYQHFHLPVPYYNNCRGSSHGWLITVDDDEHHQPDGTTYTYPVRLLNPFRSFNNEIQLPPLTTIPVVDRMNDEPGNSFYLIRAFLSANPSSLSNPADLIVFGVYGGYEFGFCRPGDIAWTHLPLERQFRPIEDLICYKGRFLAIIQNGSVLELDFAHHLPEQPSVKFVARTPANSNIATQKYLVESAGDLLQVHRDVFQKDGEDNCSTIEFRVFKLNDAAAAANNDDDEWVEMMDNLDGRMLFLGDNNSISLSAADFPGCMPDCIYFTDDNTDYYDVDPGPSDFGIFNFVDKTFARFYPMHNNTSSSMPPPIWIQPML